MELFFLIFIPVVVALIGYLISAYNQDKKYLITLKEFLVLISVVSIITTIGYFIGKAGKTADKELWNGRVVKKEKVKVSCSHAYPCNPHPCGDSKNPSTCWDVCYEHFYDYDWVLFTSNGEKIKINRIDSQGVNEPPRFTAAIIGDPTVVIHRYTNYIKGNPWSILRKQGLTEKFSAQIPNYPFNVYNYHYVDRFLVKGLDIPGDVMSAYNLDLMNLNADLGKKKEVNIIFVVINSSDSKYIQALEESWLGGKQNDFVIVMNVSEYPKIDWVRVMSWTRAEDLKIEIRDKIQEIGCICKRQEIIETVRTAIETKFVRTPMSNFEYLAAGIRPSSGVLIFLYILGIILSIGFTVWFYLEDPFDSRYY